MLTNAIRVRCDFVLTGFSKHVGRVEVRIQSLEDKRDERKKKR